MADPKWRKASLCSSVYLSRPSLSVVNTGKPLTLFSMASFYRMTAVLVKDFWRKDAKSFGNGRLRDKAPPPWADHPAVQIYPSHNSVLAVGFAMGTVWAEERFSYGWHLSGKSGNGSNRGNTKQQQLDTKDSAGHLDKEKSLTPIMKRS